MPQYVGLQVPRCMDSEVSAEDSVREVAQTPRGDAQGSRRAMKEQGGGGALDARSCPPVDLDSTEVRRCSSDMFIKGKSAIHVARTYMGRKRNFVG